MTVSPRERLVSAAMDLFGRQGFRATTVAEIEAAAGLSPGAGGLYRHFPTKRRLLEEGLRRQVDAGRDLVEFLEAAPATEQSLADQLLAVARAGLRRLEEERDVNRLLLRDLAAFPDLLAEVRDRDLRRVHATLLGWLRNQVTDDTLDLPAVAALLMGAVSHYWILTDVFAGNYPFDVDEDRYLQAVATLAARGLSG